MKRLESSWHNKTEKRRATFNGKWPFFAEILSRFNRPFILVVILQEVLVKIVGDVVQF